ncbi:GIY-YIG nuclease family protein [Nisaea nitritireducens]|uniref:GIY-YIG nuclease family protein n=1 Tax=Nisaea nitritireducens TaxID=568392 RepID=UPI0018681B0E|nr:GIY-YIG nuclease family protein [Nisaea nitritireducens]
MQPCVYILTNKKNGTLYIGVTSDLPRRVAQHRSGSIAGFTSRYGVKRLVFFEQHERMEGAIQRERQLKEWRRGWKIRLIRESNPGWRDLFPELF